MFKWYGSKWLSARHYPEPLHQDITEPFAGGAGYSLRYWDRNVILHDTDPHLRRLWPWLIEDATPDMIMDIPIDLPVGHDIRTVGLTDGQALLLKTWQRTNNVGDCWTVSPWGSLPGQWTANTRARIADEIGAVKHWSFRASDACVAMQASDARTWFIDPMYMYGYNYRAPALAYNDLAALINALVGQIIVCEGVCGKTGAIPDWLPFRPFARRVTSRRRANNNHHCQEVVYVR